MTIHYRDGIFIKRRTEFVKENGKGLLFMACKKVTVTIVIAVLLSIIIIPTALAHTGWWNNSLTFSSDGYTYKGNYRLETSRGGFLGTFSSDHSGGLFKAQMQWYDVDNGWLSHSAWTSINSNSYVEKERDIYANQSYRYRFQANLHESQKQTVVTSTAGYFWD